MTAVASLSQVIIRPGEAGDASFIHSSWFNSYLRNSRWPGVVGPCFHAEHSEVIKRLMDRSEIRVAAWSEDPETIIGWCAVEEAKGLRAIHYCFVRKEFRRQGIASRIVGEFVSPGDTAVVTHRTTDADKIRWPIGWSYNPYPALR